MASRSTKLAYLLRHDDTYNFSCAGWRAIEDLCTNHEYTLDEIHTIVEKDNKGRLELSTCGKYIRAVYGHSVDVFPDLIEDTPPSTLYHGTGIHCLDSILKTGIDKRGRNYVHLSISMTVAFEVGSRHGKPIVLEVNALKMAEDGIRFWKARNNTLWLTEYVNPSYISTLKDVEL